ncbi:MAG: SDR family oxidoreductase [Planctomycetota bacterium]|nr:MAG: SDR family oxidoreductase [Planctomycetota bacterium]
MPAYAAAKHGVVGLPLALANEWTAKHIRINAIAPGSLETDMNEAIINDPVREPKICDQIPAGRWGGRPDELIGPLLFPASDACTCVNGCTWASSVAL